MNVFGTAERIKQCARMNRHFGMHMTYREICRRLSKERGKVVRKPLRNSRFILIRGGFEDPGRE